MITRLSEYLACRLGKATGRTDKTDVMRYGFEILIGGSVSPIILFSLAYIIGVLGTCLWITVTFVVFRTLMGGYHFTTYWRCLNITLVVMLGSAWISQQLPALSKEIMLLVIILAGVAALIFTVLLVPANDTYREMTAVHKKNIRIFSGLVSISWMVLIIGLSLAGMRSEWLFGSIFGLVIQLLTMPKLIMVGLSKLEGY
jgi:accessory gene regulator B